MTTATTTAPGSIRWGTAVTAGLVAGIVFLVLEMLMVPVFGGGSPWGPPRMIGAIVLGQGVLPSPPPPPTFDFGVVAVAIILHMVLSIVFTVILAFIIARFDLGIGLAVGAVFGLLLYFVNFYGFTAVWPWFANARNWISIFAHVVFGLVAAWMYKRTVAEVAAISR